MATAVTSSKPIDLRSNGSYTIRLGDSITRSTSDNSLTAVRFNHKPTVTSGRNVTETIVNEGGDDRTKLKLDVGEDTYEYEGQAGDSECTLVLVPDESGDGFVLESLEAALVYNLTSAPWEQDSTKLAEQYTILPAIDALRAGGDVENSEEFDEDGEADQDNPFDYRHYISATSPDTEPVRDHRPTSTMNSPALSHTASHAPSSQGTPVSRPARKPANPMMPNRKPKPRSTPVTTEPITKRRNDNVPEVRVSSSKSIRKPQKPIVEDIMLDDVADDEDEDDGGLVFDDAPSKKTSANRNAGLGLSQGGLPMSLRSAASSPGSRVASPAPSSHQQGHASRSRPANGDDLVMDDDDTQTASHGHSHPHDDEVEDDDVEHLHLGSPARHQSAAPKREQISHNAPRRRSSVHGQADGDGDDDNELELAMLNALEEEDDDEPRPAIAVEEEEESEEE